MRFKLDENLPVGAASLLNEHGYDAESVYDEHLVGRSDKVVSDVAQAEGRVLVTLDLDFADERRLSAWKPRRDRGAASAVPAPRLGVEGA